MKWLKAFEAVQAATKEKDVNGAVVAHSDESPRRRPTACADLVVKLGLHQFINDHAGAASLQVDSAYADLVRLTGHDPATEISASSSAKRPNGA